MATHPVSMFLLSMQHSVYNLTPCSIFSTKTLKHYVQCFSSSSSSHSFPLKSERLAYVPESWNERGDHKKGQRFALMSCLVFILPRMSCHPFFLFFYDLYKLLLSASLCFSWRFFRVTDAFKASPCDIPVDSDDCCLFSLAGAFLDWEVPPFSLKVHSFMVALGRNALDMRCAADPWKLPLVPLLLN